MEVFLVILGIFAASTAGFYFGRSRSNGTQEKVRLETELEQKTQELQDFQNKVTSHFEKTANLFNQVSDSYQSLYDHMAHSSSLLCSTQTFRTLPKKSKVELTSESVKSSVDMSHSSTQAVFNADNLYNAYDFRTHEEKLVDTAKVEPAIVFPPAENNKVVDFESAKEDKSSPALDYAIKTKGVVNHNSLDMDSLKSTQ